MTHNLSFRYHLDMTTKELGLGSAKVEVLFQLKKCLTKTAIIVSRNIKTNAPHTITAIPHAGNGSSVDFSVDPGGAGVVG
jgi:hypothetical protein